MFPVVIDKLDRKANLLWYDLCGCSPQKFAPDADRLPTAFVDRRTYAAAIGDRRRMVGATGIFLQC
jgi:hypothetical protein